MNWCLTFILVHLKFILADQNVDQQTCEELRMNLSEKHLGIAFTNTTEKKIMLITKDFLIFDDIEMVGDQDWSPGVKHYMKFREKPKKMEQMYPKLWNNSQFMDFKDYFKQALLVQNGVEMIIYFITTDYSDDCLMYTVREPMITRYQIDYNLGPKIALLTYPYLNYFFLTRKSSDDQFYIQMNQIVMKKQWNLIIGPLYMCWAADSSNKALFVSDQNCSYNHGQPIDWEIWSGMVSENKFYLFGEDYVYIFKSSIVVDYDREQPIQIVPLFKIDYHSFISCPNDDLCTILETSQPTTFETNLNTTTITHSNLSIVLNSTSAKLQKQILKLVILEVISISLIILLALVVFWVYRQSQQNLPSSSSSTTLL